MIGLGKMIWQKIFTSKYSEWCLAITQILFRKITAKLYLKGNVTQDNCIKSDIDEMGRGLFKLEGKYLV